jgi:putative Ca2+/H+ antiporter (TMEM165/GDT1 family)
LAVLLITSNNPKQRWLIFFASAIALSLCVFIEVTVGVTLARHIAPHIINKIAGAVFLTLGIVGLINYLGSLRTGENRDSLRAEGVAEQTQ